MASKSCLHAVNAGLRHHRAALAHGRAIAGRRPAAGREAADLVAERLRLRRAGGVLADERRRGQALHAVGAELRLLRRRVALDLRDRLRRRVGAGADLLAREVLDHVDVAAAARALHRHPAVVARRRRRDLAGAFHRLVAGADEAERHPVADVPHVAHRAVLVLRDHPVSAPVLLHADLRRRRGHLHRHADHLHPDGDVPELVGPGARLEHLRRLGQGRAGGGDDECRDGGADEAKLGTADGGHAMRSWRGRTGAAIVARPPAVRQRASGRPAARRTPPAPRSRPSRDRRGRSPAAARSARRCRACPSTGCRAPAAVPPPAGR